VGVQCGSRTRFGCGCLFVKGSKLSYQRGDFESGSGEAGIGASSLARALYPSNHHDASRLSQ